MSVASSNLPLNERSVAEVVAAWRERCAHGEAVDSRQMLDEIEQAKRIEERNVSLSPHDFPDAAPATDEHSKTPTVKALLGADLPSTPTAGFEKPQSRHKERFRSPGGKETGGSGLDDYEVLREIAHGGMGIVYEARQRSLNRIVALKMIRVGQLANEEEVARFYAEAEAAANLRHPNIVAVYEVGRAGQHADQHYFTMDYISGPSLLEMIRKQPLTSREAAGYVAKIARAIQFAHERNVLHRDLKPSNILLSDAGEPLVTDFGLAKRIGQDTQLTIAGAVIGTPAYMPPEQARGDQRSMGPAADVYSLGAILYECVTGRPPFVSSSLTEMLSQVVEDEPLPPSRLVSRLPRDYETICLKCLEKLPKNRYATAGELADDLERFLRDEPIAARPVNLLERAVKFARRKPAWAALWAAAALFVVILATTITIYTSRLSASNTALNSSKSKLEATVTNLRNTNYAALIDKTEDYWSHDPRNLARGRELLKSLEPGEGEEDLRGIEWYFLRRLCDLDEQVVYEGTDQISHLACRDDDSLLVHDLGRESSLFLISGGKRGNPQGFAGAGNPQRVQFSPTSPWCLIWTQDWKLELRSRESPGEAGVVIGEGDERTTRASLAADGETAVILSQGQPAALWQRDVPNKFRAIATAFADPLDVLMSPDGKWAAVMSRTAFALVNTATKKTSFIQPTLGLRHYTSLAFSPDSQRLALASSQGQLDVVLLGEKITLASVRLKRDFAVPNALTFLPDSRRLAIGSSNAEVIVIDLRNDVVSMTEQDEAVYRGHRSGVTHLVADPAGKFLYSAAQDGQVLRWDLAIRDQRTHDIRGQLAEWFSNFHCLCYSPDGRWLAAGGTAYESGTQRPVGELLLIEVATRHVSRLAISSAEPVVQCSFSPDSRLLLYGCGSEDRPSKFHIWNVERSRPEPDREELAASAAACYAGGHLIFANSSGALIAENIASHQATHWSASKVASARVLELLASSGGNVVVSQTDNEKLHCWDSFTGREISSGHECDEHPEIAVSAKGELLAATVRGNKASATNRQAVVYETGSGTERLAVGGHSSPIQALALSADGTRLASGDQEGILRIWDVVRRLEQGNNDKSRELLTIENSHLGGVKAIAFHPRGRQMASIGERDALVRIWWTE